MHFTIPLKVSVSAHASTKQGVQAVACKFLGGKSAAIVDVRQGREQRVPLWTCTCDERPERFTSGEYLRSRLVVIEHAGERTPGTVACCHGCPFRVEAEKPKPSLAERVGQKRAERDQEWEAYLASTAHLPGTILHGIVKSKGHGISTDCKCKAMIRRMNEGGPEWCVEHRKEIVDTMVSEAKRRKIEVKIPLTSVNLPQAVVKRDMLLRGQAKRWVRQAVREAREVSQVHN